MERIRDSECACSLGHADAFGHSGWHFIVAGEDYCWKTKLKPASRGSGEKPRQFFVERREAEDDDGNREVITTCGCTYRRELHKRGEAPMVEVEEPHCLYAGRMIAYERCPAYVAKIHDSDGDEYRIDPTNRHRLLSPEAGRQRAKRQRDSGSLTGRDYGLEWGDDQP